MKSYIKIFLFLFLLIVALTRAPVPVSADNNTVEQLQAQLEALLEQVRALQVQLIEVQGGAQPTTQTPAQASAAACTFTRSLAIGSVGEDVKCLQKFLNSSGFPPASSGLGSSGNETNYFGSLTQRAVANWQAASGVSPAAGYFGPISRGEYQKLKVEFDLTVLSPNGGETWKIGTTQTIRWQDNRPEEILRHYDITLVENFPPCDPPGPCPVFSRGPFVYTIAKKVTASSYNWKVGQVLDHVGNSLTAPVGLYQVRISDSFDDSFHDFSDESFEIVADGGVNLPPVITGISGPTVLKVGEAGKWQVKAYDPEQGQLTYSVVWGDASDFIPVQMSAIEQTVTFTHVYNSPGTYTPTFTITDNAGLSAKTSISVEVSDVTVSDLTVLSPNGGETWKIGTTQTIRWQDNRPIIMIAPSPVRYYNILLEPYPVICQPGPCMAPYGIARRVTGSSYSWTVGNWGEPGYPPETVRAGTYKVRVCNSDNNVTVCDVSDNYFKIVAESGLTIITTSLPLAVTGMNYRATVSSSGGTGDIYGWYISSGSLPPGLKLLYPVCITWPCPAREVYITGIPTALGSYPFTLTVITSTQSASREFVIEVASMPLPATQ